MKGYIKLHREIQNHWLWEEPRRLRAWLYLLFEAAWEPRTIPWGKDESVTLCRGQIATSIRKLNGRWGYCTETTLALLKLFEEQGMITRETSAKRSLITIVNYEKYQLFEDSAERKVERKVERKSKHNKEKEEKIINNNINLSLSREQDLIFIEQLKSDEKFFEDVAVSLHIEIQMLKDLYEEFSKSMLIKNKYHKDCADYRQHFYNWVSKVLENAAESKNNADYGRTRQKAGGDKYEARRGTGVSAKTADDFQESF